MLFSFFTVTCTVNYSTSEDFFFFSTESSVYECPIPFPPSTTQPCLRRSLSQVSTIRGCSSSSLYLNFTANHLTETFFRQSRDVSGTWSHKATRGSPPPTLQPGQGEAIHSGSPLPTKGSQKKNNEKAQDNALRGVGSQFPPVGMYLWHFAHILHPWEVD